jgi:UDP-N-acetylglucosamine 2-epimerase
MQKNRWLSIVGARPQFIKVAPVCRAMEAYRQAGKPPGFEHCIVNTGQHYDREMAELFFVQLGIPEPKYNLGVGSGTHAEQLARTLERLEPVLTQERPDGVIVYGDTNSTLAGALLAARLNFRLAHIEAGCRSFNLSMPEEQNRKVADHLSQVLLTPSQRATENLWAEGIGTPEDPLRRRVALVGDVMYDALLANARLAEPRVRENLRAFGLEENKYYLLTLHRAENTESPKRLRSLLEGLRNVDLPVLFPVHPRTRKVLKEAGVALDDRNLKAVAPLGYLDMLAIEKHARRILTDSGGVQKEAFYLRVPCVTLRDETEWPETVELGANQLAGTDLDNILKALRTPHSILDANAMPYGDGHACERILEELLPADSADRPLEKVVVYSSYSR